MASTDSELERTRAARDAQLASEQTGSRAGARALCLSGGGYRAALFHLGALWRLQQIGWLPDVDQISSVSGGSIVSAWLATRYLEGRRDESESFAEWCRRIDFRAQVVEPFRAVVARDLRSVPVLATFGWNLFRPSARVARLERGYRRFLGERVLDDLPDSPGFVFCATNLSLGVNWEFSRRRVGDYLSGYLVGGGRIALATAVAASSCFPPVFGPMRLAADAGDFRGGKYDRGAEWRGSVELSDGGLYDNLGTEPALRNYRQVLVSDAGAPFPFVARQNAWRRLLRYTEVIGNQAGALRKRLFFTLCDLGQMDGRYWSLHGRHDFGGHGYSPALVTRTIGRVRTDLDRFSAAEFEVLVNHGYFSCEDGLQARPDSPSAGAPAPEWPFPARAVEADVARDLVASHRRFWPPRWWRR